MRDRQLKAEADGANAQQQRDVYENAIKIIGRRELNGLVNCLATQAAKELISKSHHDISQ